MHVAYPLSSYIQKKTEQVRRVEESKGHNNGSLLVCYISMTDKMTIPPKVTRLSYVKVNKHICSLIACQGTTMVYI